MLKLLRSFNEQLWPGCEICRRLRINSEWPLMASFVELNSSAESGCSVCMMLRDAVSAFEDATHVRDIGAWVEDQESPKRIGWRSGLRLHFRMLGGDDVGETLHVYCTDKHVAKRWPFLPIGAHISSNSSSPECLDGARKWLEHCLQKHSTAICGRMTNPGLPTRVICVRDHCRDPFIYEPSPGEAGSYAALSYCWGETEAFVTTISTYAQRKAGFAIDELPKTCRDAVIVARALKIPYLWIDSLCIIQDSVSDWEYEASHMCSVFENSLVTIAASDSVDNEGGLFRTNPYRNTAKLKVSIDKAAPNKSVPTYAYARKYSQVGRFGHRFVHGFGDEFVLESRGWTLQELTLSPRILWFTADELGWQCLSETACECDPVPKKYVPGLHDNESSMATAIRSALHQPNPEWGRVWPLVVEYFSKRDLTRPTDRLEALSGLAKAAHRHLQSNDEYIFGLWRNSLQTQLLWTSSCSLGVDTALKCSKIKSVDGSDYAPSWSWASISGPVFLPFYESREYSVMWNILNVHVVRNGTNLYGSGSGHIDVEGSLIQLVLKGNELEIPDVFDYHYFRPDPMYMDRRKLIGELIFFLPALHLSAFVSPCICGLVLVCMRERGNDIFHRAGVLSITFEGTSTSPATCMSWPDGISRARQKLTII